jgi:hypothetical protein
VELDLAGLALAGVVMRGAGVALRGAGFLLAWLWVELDLAGVALRVARSGWRGGVRSGWFGSCW